MTNSNFNFDSTSSIPVVSANSLVVDLTRERRSKTHHDCNISGRAAEEPVVHASPLTAILALENALGVPVADQYGNMVRLAERSLLLFPPGEPSSSKPARASEEGAPTPGPSDDEDVLEDEVSSVN